MDSTSPSPTPFNRGAKLPSHPSSIIIMGEAATTPSTAFDIVQNVQIPSTQHSSRHQVKAKAIRRPRLTKTSRAPRSMATNAKIKKSAQKPAMGTRSRNLAKFYQLDLSGAAIPQRYC
jgi:hypothetical protein